MEKPILFSTEMVQAILEGRKTQTRRIFKGTTEHKETYNTAYLERWQHNDGWKQICPYGRVGDRLWVRETWQCIGSRNCSYKASGDVLDKGFKWHPSIFMPRWASRITLEITDIKVQKLWDITEDDAKAEGIGVSETLVFNDNYKDSYTWLWDKINGKKHPWSDNPWVWVISFKRIEQ